jgi:hypothetical protein
LALQIRDESGIEEQVSFVRGPRRYLTLIDVDAGTDLPRQWVVDLSGDAAAAAR